jgi:outer membrane protein OmpA-like peptidoglycan-associated protein
VTAIASVFAPAVAQAAAQGVPAAAAASASMPGPFQDFRLEPPSPVPKSLGEHDDFPYLAPLPGSALLASEHGLQGLDVTTPEDDETHIVGTQTLARTYARPPGVDDDTWLRVYARALRDAGWTVMWQERRANDGAHVVAHYAAGGRDLWIRLATAPGQYTLTTVDVGDDLGHLLARACRATIYGVDFAADRPEIEGPAEPVLMELRQLLRNDHALRLQVIVHLDASDVPNDPAGARRLSQQQAEAIRFWLGRHRVDIDRVTPVGAGADHPLQPSDTEEHRARNRRVELVRDGCR